MDNPAISQPDAEAGLAARIMQAGAAPDRDAEAALYRCFAPRVRLYGLKHLRDEEAAADLVQHVLLTTLESLRAGKLREPERITSFIFGTCRMAVLDQRRGGYRRERLLQQFADDIPLADAAIAPRLDHERVATCLERLSERERAVLLMTFYEEQPAPVVAGYLGVTEGNVRVIRHRGLASLRDCVNGRRDGA